MTSKKGLVFGDTFMALIIGTVVVIMIVVGSSLSYQNLACYTGLKWFMESPGAHLGTIANSKVTIISLGPQMTNFTVCNKTCFDNYDVCVASKKASDEQAASTESCEPPDCDSYDGTKSCDENTCQEVNCDTGKQNCVASCTKKYPDKTADYVFFNLEIGYSGTSPSALNISEYYEDSAETLLWYNKTGVMKEDDSTTMTSKPFKVMKASLVTFGSDNVIFRGTAIEKIGLVPAEQSFELKINGVDYVRVK